jgi:hypothetical protein
MRIGVGLSRAVALAALAASVALPPAGARAQFGFGGFGYGGFGYGGVGGIYGAQTNGMINSWALQNGQKATMGPVQDNVYANNPNAYINHLHDDGYLDKYDVGTRREIEASVGRYSDGPPPSYYRPVSRPAPARPAPAQPTAPIVPISSFFDRYQKLVWPGGSPDFGDLAARRTTADLACLGVLNDYNIHGLAQVGTVTEARSKLVEYGRPALQYIRDNSTPRVADTFHLFLLSLYESLAQAATIPKTPTPSPAPVSAPPAPPAAVTAPAPRP